MKIDPQSTLLVTELLHTVYIRKNVII